MIKIYIFSDCREYNFLNIKLEYKINTQADKSLLTNAHTHAPTDTHTHAHMTELELLNSNIDSVSRAKRHSC